MKHRVMRLITWLPNGGIERKIAAVLPRLNHELFEVHLCCIRERGPLADQIESFGIPVHVIPFRSRMDPVAVASLNALVRRLGISLVHSHMYRANVPATLLKLFTPRLKVVGHYHNVNTWESGRQRFVDRQLALRRDMNVAVSEAVRRNVIETLDIPEERTRTLYNCVDTAAFHPVSAAERQAIRSNLGLPTFARVVIMLARLVRQKNQEMVLRCVPEIVSEQPNAHFLFVGGGPDEARLRQLAEELSLQSHVTFLGNRMDAPQLLAASDVSILPSLKEGFSNTILESMASGLPVIASDVGGNAEVIDTGVNGFIIDASETPGGVEVNSTQFVRYLRRLLTDDELRGRVSAAALDTIQNFTLDAMVQDIEDLYMELLEG